MSFFRYMPSITYRGKAAPNIMLRVAIPKQLLNTAELYQPYVVEDGDRPESIAGLYYNDVEKDWLIKLANNIFDEASQWPLTQPQLERFLREKYNSVEYTLSTIDHYKLKRTIPPIDSGAYSSLTTTAKKYWFQTERPDVYNFISKDWTVTVETWNNMNAGERDYWVPVSVYDVEFEINEQKRFIKLIDRTYAPLFDEALKTAMLENDG